MLADSIKQARKQEFAGRIGASEETGNQISCSSAFPFLAGKTRRIDEGAIGFVAVQEAFFEKAVESGHYGGVREGSAQLGDDFSDAAFSVGPENFHQFEFEGAESQGSVWIGHAMDATFQEANHYLLFIGPSPETGKIVSPLSRRGKKNPANGPAKQRSVVIIGRPTPAFAECDAREGRAVTWRCAQSDLMVSPERVFWIFDFRCRLAGQFL